MNSLVSLSTRYLELFLISLYTVKKDKRKANAAKKQEKDDGSRIDDDKETVKGKKKKGTKDAEGEVASSGIADKDNCHDSDGIDTESEKGGKDTGNGRKDAKDSKEHAKEKGVKEKAKDKGKKKVKDTVEKGDNKKGSEKSKKGKTVKKRKSTILSSDESGEAEIAPKPKRSRETLDCGEFGCALRLRN